MSSLRQKWRRWVMTIDRVILDEIRVDKVVFDEYVRIVEANPFIQTPSTFHHWVFGNYGRGLVLQVRRLADADGRAYSLRRLLEDIRHHPQQLTRSAFLRQFRGRARTYGLSQWKKNAGRHAPPTLPLSVIERDIAFLKRISRRAGTLVSKEIAHLDRKRRLRHIGFEDVFAILNKQAALIAKYAELVGYAMPGTIENGAYGEDWARLFEQPWIVEFKEPLGGAESAG